MTRESGSRPPQLRGEMGASFRCAIRNQALVRMTSPKEHDTENDRIKRIARGVVNPIRRSGVLRR